MSDCELAEQLASPYAVPSVLPNQIIIQRYLDSVDRDLEAYNEQICDLEATLANLRAIRDTLHERRSRLSSLFAPVRRLQSEVLQDIFLSALAGLGGDNGNIFGSNNIWTSRTLRLSSVCSRWRTIVLDMPALWSSFAFDLQARARYPVELFVSRSRDQLLSVRITSFPHVSASGLKTLGMIVANTGRIAWLDYHGLTHQGCLKIFNSKLFFPSLRHTFWTSDNTSGLQTPAPLLDTVVCRYVKDTTLRLPTSVPLNQLRNITFQWGPPLSLIDIFRVLRAHELQYSLEYLCFASPPGIYTTNGFGKARHLECPEVEGDAVELQGLKELRIALYDRDGVYLHIADIMGHLSLPSLTTLHLIGDCDRDGMFQGIWPRTIIHRFFTRSWCGGILTAVIFDGIPIPDSDIIAFLNHTPSLESLMLNELFAKNHSRNPVNGSGLGFGESLQSISKTFINALNTRRYPSQTAFLPKLRSLHLRAHNHFDADDEFVDMVRSRWHPRQLENESLGYDSIREVSLMILNRDLDSQVYEPLKVLEKEGLRVVVSGNGRIVV